MISKKHGSFGKKIIQQYQYFMSEKKEIVGSHVLLVLMVGLFLHILFPPAYLNAKLQSGGEGQQEYLEHYAGDLSTQTTCIPDDYDATN